MSSTQSSASVSISVGRTVMRSSIKLHSFNRHYAGSGDIDIAQCGAQIVLHEHKMRRGDFIGLSNGCRSCQQREEMIMDGKGVWK